MSVEIMPANQPTKYPHECCNVPGNLVKLENESHKKLLVMQCQVCKCRHRELTVDRAEINVLTKDN